MSASRSEALRAEAQRVGVGSVVRLKSGGPRLTVASLTDGNRSGLLDARCVWIDEMGHEHEATYDTRALEVAA